MLPEETTIALEIAMLLNDATENITTAYDLCHATIKLEQDDRIRIVTNDGRVFYVTVTKE